jgi:hypothetical protein
MRKRQAALFGEIQIAVGHRALNFAGAAHRIDDAGEFRQHAVAGGFDDPAVMLADLWIEQFDKMRLEAFVRAFLIGSHQKRIAYSIGPRIAARRRAAVVAGIARAGLTPAPNLPYFERERGNFVRASVRALPAEMIDACRHLDALDHAAQKRANDPPGRS